MRSFIYSLICPIRNEIRYIGQTSRVDLSIRLKEHRGDACEPGNNHRLHWLRKLRSLNLLKKLSIQLIEETDDVNVNSRESYWIHYYESQGCDLVNSPGIHGCFHIHTPEVREAIRKASKNKPRKEVSLETRRKISESLIGSARHCKPHTAETKQKYQIHVVELLPGIRNV